MSSCFLMVEASVLSDSSLPLSISNPAFLPAFSPMSTAQMNGCPSADKAWAKTCRRLVLTLNDGAQYTAHFEFLK